MSVIRQLFSISTSVLLLAGPVLAQDAAVKRAGGGPAVAASSTAAGVRFVAPGEARRVRLEIYSADGSRLFDSGFRAGGVYDWDGRGLADGSYLCVLTAEDIEGGQSRRLSAVAVEGGRAALGKEGGEQLKAAFAQALAAAGIEPGDARAAARAKKTNAVTVTAHDGTDGQVTSTSGALTFRTGDLFSGQEREQMRVTPDGRVGIGTSSPEDALDVAGTIRARGGIRFDDGTVLTSAREVSKTNLVSAGAMSTGSVPTANASGTGTANKLPKWLDGSGTLGDSVVSEAGGNVGVGVNNPGDLLEIAGAANSSGRSGVRVRTTSPTGNSTLYLENDRGNFSSYGGLLTGGSQNSLSFFGVPRADRTFLLADGATSLGLGLGTLTAQPVLFGTGNQERMRITPGGNVGVGTTNPSSRLEVAGDLRVSGGGSGIVFADGTKQTSAAASVGGSNTWTGSQVFSVGLSANNAQITNVGNPTAAGDAVNKAYTDANFVKFVPGAEQLSVGDANGTTPMINLRGGSTCCSGPGGHTPAWFKVFQNGSFVATGNLGIGVSPMQGKGYRTSWDSYKGAFRSGYADNEWDDATVGFFSWAGGSNSTAEGLYAFAFGDTNFARSTSSIAFGSGNEVKGAAGFSAGAGNRVCDTYGVAFGNKAQSGGPLINGKCDPDTFNIRGLAAVAIGYNVTADQDHTTALGKFASNNGWSGTFIWSDGSAVASADTFRNTANNEFAARATGGFRFRTNLGGTTGCNLPAGSGVFNCTSSRTTKENFSLVDGDDVLAKLRKVPVSTWNYISEGSGARHLGPMAEDFYSAFQLGTSDKAIGVQDAVGVSLAAVKALDARTLELQQKTQEVEQLRKQVNTLEQRLAALEALVQKQGEGGLK
jgi:hypothetical protein